MNRTPSHIACTDADTLSAHHVTRSRVAQVELCAQNIFSFHLFFRAMSHDLHSTPSILSSFSLSSSSPSFTGSGSRLITSRIHCADSRDLSCDGFKDPRTSHRFDNPIVTEQEGEHSTEESQIPEIEDKGKKLIYDIFRCAVGETY